MTEVSLGVFAKAPEGGSVKSRLAPVLGVAGARAAHCELVTNTLSRMSDRAARFRAVLWVTEHTPTTARWSTEFKLPCHLQVGPDLGMRMSNALDVMLQGDSAGAGIVGTDCPTIDVAYVNAGCSLLKLHDVVFGPAEDGGYGLVMCKRALPELFADISWGTGTVLTDSLQRAKQLNLSVGLLDSIWDVDRPQDWARYLQYRRALAPDQDS